MAGEQQGELQLVVFHLKEQTYGVDIGHVLEIIRASDITAIPGAPDFVEGVINLRGRVIPVIDLARRLGLAPINVTGNTRIVIVEVGGTTAGMMVDGVSEVLRLPRESIQPPPAMVAGVSAAYLQGIALVDDRLIILLDTTRIFRREEKEALQELAEQAEERAAS
ncbi:purine-binding chemotaxis protein CheW [Desulfofundulus luciae]|uniref:Purine-binding chemotaxis protein CheW n=1 Tax=Desulfofundulus luciae TaxID=74702 RepID=A0ABU0AZZ6_9FIRM|nr:chemotaxis protein CheW [Desulfofundulus luciae]MDQ0285637.1 purine-binding chemotaxis protein CheW [Desulfofundulus luciae]